jgi:hypothetical protein
MSSKWTKSMNAYATGPAAAVVTVAIMSAARTWTHFRDEIIEVADER